MLRFKSNRWWAFVLTLCLFTCCLLALSARFPSVASASDGSYSIADQSPVPGGSVGDPDVPMGPGDGKAGKTCVVRGGVSEAVLQNGARPVGDGAVSTSVVMDRLHLFLLGLRSFYLRF
jgi:hypothetical protein